MWGLRAMRLRLMHVQYCTFVDSEGKETDLTPWCLGVMANLCRNNLSLQTFVKGKVSLLLHTNNFFTLKSLEIR